jgi:integrase
MLLESAHSRQKARTTAGRRTTFPHPPENLQGLLESIRNSEHEKTHLHAMLNALAGHIAMALGRPARTIQIRELLDMKPGLRRYLEKKRFRRSSINSYVNYLRILVRKARELGWRECNPKLTSAWAEVRRATSKSDGCSEIIRYAIGNGIEPRDFTEAHVMHWAEAAVRNGRRHEYIVGVKRRFRKCVFDAGLGSKLPNLLPPRVDRVYGIPLSRFPEPLRSQVLDLLQWKVDEFPEDRPTRNKIRPISAWSLKCLLCQLFGFLVGIKGRSTGNLKELLSRNSVVEFVQWALNQRRRSGRSLRVELARIAGLTAYPGLAGLDFSWLPKVVARLPMEPDSRARERKNRRWVPYQELAEIPNRIRSDAAAIPDLTDKARAEMGRDALLVALLTTLAWRQKNIREAKLGRFQDEGNISMEEIPANSIMAKPQWVQDALRTNPHQKIWQFRFGAEETKGKREARGVLPLPLVSVLQEYLDRHRPILLGAHPDPGTLFLNGRGKPFGRGDVLRLTGAVTMKYVNKRLNPHLFRDILALQYLEDCPEDFASLSQALWHGSVGVTMGFYARNFDASHGARRIQEWLEKRRKGS